jgi:cytochrome c556
LNWIQECDKQPIDTRCHIEDAALPAQVLDANSEAPGGVALYESGGETGRYAALSHVWGETNPFTSTRAKLEAHKECIEVERLQRTISDAISVTRMMSIRYLWIDALWYMIGLLAQDDQADGA